MRKRRGGGRRVFRWAHRLVLQAPLFFDSFFGCVHVCVHQCASVCIRARASFQETINGNHGRANNDAAWSSLKSLYLGYQSFRRVFLFHNYQRLRTMCIVFSLVVLFGGFYAYASSHPRRHIHPILTNQERVGRQDSTLLRTGENEYSRYSSSFPASSETASATCKQRQRVLVCSLYEWDRGNQGAEVKESTIIWNRTSKQVRESQHLYLVGPRPSRSSGCPASVSQQRPPAWVGLLA